MAEDINAEILELKRAIAEQRKQLELADSEPARSTLRHALAGNLAQLNALYIADGTPTLGEGLIEEAKDLTNDNYDFNTRAASNLRGAMSVMNQANVEVSLLRKDISFDERNVFNPAAHPPAAARIVNEAADGYRQAIQLFVDAREQLFALTQLPPEKEPASINEIQAPVGTINSYIKQIETQLVALGHRAPNAPSLGEQTAPITEHLVGRIVIPEVIEPTGAAAAGAQTAQPEPQPQPKEERIITPITPIEVQPTAGGAAPIELGTTAAKYAKGFRYTPFDDLEPGKKANFEKQFVVRKVLENSVILSPVDDNCEAQHIEILYSTNPDSPTYDIKNALKASEGAPVNVVLYRDYDNTVYVTAAELVWRKPDDKITTVITSGDKKGEQKDFAYSKASYTALMNYLREVTALEVDKKMAGYLRFDAHGTATILAPDQANGYEAFEAKAYVGSMNELFAPLLAQKGEAKLNAELQAYYNKTVQGKTLKELLALDLPAGKSLTVYERDEKGIVVMEGGKPKLRPAIKKLGSNMYFSSKDEIPLEVKEQLLKDEELLMAVTLNRSITTAVSNYIAREVQTVSVDGKPVNIFEAKIAELMDLDYLVKPVAIDGKETGVPGFSKENCKLMAKEHADELASGMLGRVAMAAGADIFNDKGLKDKIEDHLDKTQPLPADATPEMILERRMRYLADQVDTDPGHVRDALLHNKLSAVADIKAAVDSDRRKAGIPLPGSQPANGKAALGAFEAILGSMAKSIEECLKDMESDGVFFK